MSNINLESLNLPGHFIRHAAFLGELTRRRGPVNDFAFTLITRGTGKVAIRSVNFRDRFLRHRDFRIHLEGPAGGGDGSGCRTARSSSSRGWQIERVSFRSLNFPDRYLRHRDFHLVLDAPSGPDDQLFRRDATFVRRPAAVLIDDGTELNPA